MNLSNSQRKFLRGLTHDLEPVVMVADKGLSDNVRAEIEQALEHHELIKVKLRAEREQRNVWAADIKAETRSELIHQIGQVACFYRRHPTKPKIQLPR